MSQRAEDNSPPAQPGSNEPAEALAQGRIGEHYVVVRELGRGGMATVYLCTDARTGQVCAVKVLRAELGSAVANDRFVREIEFASRLTHPRIPAVLDTGVTGDLPYYVMPYIEGESLRARIARERQLPIADAIRIALQVAEPMAYAHERGIVHRDIKPENVLIAPDGVYVFDFGVARAVVEAAGDRLTSTGVALGTPAYMSPEQALGDRDIDVRSDVYALGCVLYEMIAGLPPFVGPTAQSVISRRFAAPPPPMSELRDGVSPALQHVVDCALKRAPADRWQSAAEFGEALRQAALAVDTDAGQRPQRRRERVLLASAVAAALVLAAVGVRAWIAGGGSPVERAEAAIDDWDFPAAEAVLRQALGDDGSDPHAQLMLAQILMLQDVPVTHWRAHLVNATDQRTALSPEEQLRADGLAAIAAGDLMAGCGRLRELAGRPAPATRDYMAQLAYAECLRLDSTVVPDASSPSGFRFRTSYHNADSIYEAVLLRHSDQPLAYATLMPKLTAVLPMDKSGFRYGHVRGPPRQSFLSLPALVSDTLAYVPFPISYEGRPWRTPDAEGLEAAVVRNRARLRALAVEWARLAPGEPRAHEMLGRVLEATGELSGTAPSALAEFALARRLAGAETGPGGYARRLRLGVQQVRIHLRVSQFERAGALTDSLLAEPEPSGLTPDVAEDAIRTLTVLATLRGQGLRAIELQQRSVSPSSLPIAGGQVLTLPPAISRDWIAIESYAAFGGPADSILAINRRITRNVSALVPARQAGRATDAILMRPLTLATPVVGPGPIAELGTTSDWLALAQKALAQGDRRSVRSYLDSLADLSADYAPGEISMDVVYGKSWLYLAVGDTAAARDQLDKALGGFTAALPSALRHPILAAFLVRVMALNAELAWQAGERDTARYWAEAVLSMWGRGDISTAPTLARLRSLR